MAANDPETLVAYYCFVNLGWKPHEYDDLPYREKVLVSQFVLKEMESRKKNKA